MRTLTIDIVSDVVCPWCIIGYKRLQTALDLVSNEITADIHWHPFELNPTMPLGGENLREHLARKYGTTEQASIAARETLTQLGKEVGFPFHFYDEMRIYNTRKAHQLLMWAKQQNKQHQLQLALFEAYFCHKQRIDDENVLLAMGEQVGLDPQKCREVLHDDSWATAVANTEQQWLQAGITAVPAIIIEQKHLISGAQSTEKLVEVLKAIAHKAASIH